MPLEQEYKFCSTCEFCADFSGEEKPRWECRKNTPVRCGDAFYAPGVFPLVTEGTWCGEWAKKEIDPSQL